MGAKWGLVVALLVCRLACLLVQAVGLFKASGPAGAGYDPLVVCSRLLSALLLCLWSIKPEYGSISRFKGVFRGFCVFGVGLCCLGGLRGLWGFCARVELGG